MRSWPVTMSLASIESNAPAMTSPSTMPLSRRTPGPDGGWNTLTVPGAGRKPRPASSPLMRNSKEWAARRRVAVAERLAVRDAELLADQVDAGDLLGHGVLDLQAGVDLEERDRAVLADEELARPGAGVAGLLEDGLRRPVELGVLRRRRGTAPGPPRRASGGGAAASSRGSRRRRRCRGCRPGTGSRRGAACRGSARRSTRRGRRPRRPRGWRSRTARGSPRGCGRPSGRGRHRRRPP